jgi:hypothetical protein
LLVYVHITIPIGTSTSTRQRLARTADFPRSAGIAALGRLLSFGSVCGEA